MVCGADIEGESRGGDLRSTRCLRTNKLERASPLRGLAGGVIRSYDRALRTCVRRKNYRLFCV